MRQQCDQREQPQQQRRGARNRLVRPLALRLDAQVRPAFFQRHFLLPAQHKPFECDQNL